MFQHIGKILRARESRYLLAGAWNTLIGYTVGVGLLYAFHEQYNAAVIGLASNVLCINVSFLSYKVFVFRTKGNWATEYFRCYLVYGASAILASGALWVLVDYAGIRYWLAQALVTGLVVVFSYVSHARFTFRNKLNKEESK